MKIGETLYKRSTKGKLLQWEIFVKDNSYWAEHGEVGGKIVVDSMTMTQGKNIGRSNETTPEEQAVAEAQSRYDKKKSINKYSESKSGADQKKFSVTLAHKFSEHGHKLPDVVMVSPKLDGIRCYITKDGAFSRNSKRFVSTKFIEADLKKFFEEYPDAVLDGELYNHNYKNDFPELVRLIKREKNFTDEQWKRIEDDLQYHIFDVFFANQYLMRYNARMRLLDNEIANLTFSKRIHIVLQRLVAKADFMDAYAEYMQDGYEGVMLRDPSSHYEMKRSYKLLKYKEFDDGEFKIVDVLEGQGNRGGMAGKLVVSLPNGNTCEAGLRGNQAYFTKLLNEKDFYIGKKATIRYQGLTPDGALRFPVCVGIRNYE